ncbi:retrovirus-related pol polyprotein from transposon TNT 1-94 [Tanacetum coccineum]
METIHVNFDELTAMASEQRSLGPALYEMTPRIITSRLFNPPPSVVSPVRVATAPRPADLTSSPSSTTIDQVAPSVSTSSTIHVTQSLVISKGVEEQLQPLQLVDDPFLNLRTLKPSSHESSSTMDVKTAFLNDELRKVVYVSQPEGFVDQDNPTHVYRLHAHGIFINQSKYALEIIKKYGMQSSDPVDTPMVDKRKLDKDLLELILHITLAKPIEKHLHAVKRIFRYLKGTSNMGLWYSKNIDITLTAYVDHVGCQDSRRSTSGSA